MTNPTSSYIYNRLVAITLTLCTRHHLWYTYLVFFFIVIIVVDLLSFLMGRIVNITTQTTFDRAVYDEVTVFGDVTEMDVARYASSSAYSSRDHTFTFVNQITNLNNFERTDGSFYCNGSVSQPLIYLANVFELPSQTSTETQNRPLTPWCYNTPSYFTAEFGSDVVYFTDPYPAQLRTDGAALGSAFAKNGDLLNCDKRANKVLGEPAQQRTNLLQ